MPFSTSWKAGEDGSAAPLNRGEIDETELQRALDEIEQATGYTLTGPVRELVGTQIVNVLSKGLGVIARNDRDDLPDEQVRHGGAGQRPREGAVRPFEPSQDRSGVQRVRARPARRLQQGQADGEEPAEHQGTALDAGERMPEA